MVGGLRIARIFGIPVYLHPTWFPFFLLIVFALAPQSEAVRPGWSVSGHYALATATALLFFGSILLHELGHSVLALRHRVAVRSITLFFFGGVALMERDPDHARAEFEIAIAGPIVSALLALGFAVGEGAVGAGGPTAFVCKLLFRINLGVALFNLLPGFPLDGGRVLRAFLWAWLGDLARATRAAAGAGQVIAYGLLGVGLLQALEPGLLGGGRFGGVWLALIGWILLGASGATLRQVTVEASLRGLRATDLMAPIGARIDSATPVAAFARDFVMRGRRWALVEEGGRLVGLVSLSDMRRIDPDAWETTPVSRIATPAARILTAAPDTPVRDLLVAMGARDVNQIPILEGDRVVGAVSRETLLHAIDLRQRVGA